MHLQKLQTSNTFHKVQIKSNVLTVSYHFNKQVNSIQCGSNYNMALIFLKVVLKIYYLQ